MIRESLFRQKLKKKRETVNKIFISLQEQEKRDFCYELYSSL